jgi:hypothetical protein
VLTIPSHVHDTNGNFEAFLILF